MLSYQHRYHVGNFADLHKHMIQCLLLNTLTQKEKPFSVLDLYAGEGLYGLKSTEAQRFQEAERGLFRLQRLITETKAEIPDVARPYLDAVRQVAGAQPPSLYAGSAELARLVLRDQDRLILNELHPSSHQILKSAMGGDARISLHQRDAVEALSALVPPMPRRGLVILDPSFEVAAEYQKLPKAILDAIKKWATGIFMLWFPLLPDGRHIPMMNQLQSASVPSLTSLWLDPIADAGKGLIGSGVVVLNPPWKLDQSVETLGGWLTRIGFLNEMPTPVLSNRK